MSQRSTVEPHRDAEAVGVAAARAGAGVAMDRNWISGRTKLYPILADPITQVRAPSLLNPLFLQHGFDAVCLPVHVAAADLVTIVAALRTVRNLGGVIVTVPHKEAMALLCDELTDQARLTGAVNIVRCTESGRLLGAMFDGAGFVASLKAHGIEPRGQRVWIAGAGGAAAGIGFALAAAGVASIDFNNRSAQRAQALAARISMAYPACTSRMTLAGPGDIDLIVNTTTLGLKPDDPLPISEAALLPGTVLAEIIMDPPETSLMKVARRRGLKIVPGAPMLDHQMALMLEFLGVAPNFG